MNDTDNKWSPELKIQAFKEIVSAVMGLAVVVFTLGLAWASIGYSANDTQMANVKDVLLLVLGLAGVVIGYYFGRIPADARATQANDRAQQVTTAAAAAADELDGVLAASSGAATANSRELGADDGATSDELRQVRDRLRTLARV